MQLKKFVVNFHKQLLGPQSLFLDPYAIKSFYFVEFSNLMHAKRTPYLKCHGRRGQTGSTFYDGDKSLVPNMYWVYK